jgi:hypothetical protein
VNGGSPCNSPAPTITTQANNTPIATASNEPSRSLRPSLPERSLGLREEGGDAGDEFRQAEP